MITFKKVRTEDFELSRIQDNIDETLRSLSVSSPIVGGVFVTATIGTADTPVNHTLGRAYLGWIVCDKSGVGDVYRSSTTNPRPKDQIILKSTASVTVKLLVF